VRPGDGNEKVFMAATIHLGRRLPLLAALLCACASTEEPAPGVWEKNERRRRVWELRMEENRRIRKQRAALLPDALARFDAREPSAWQQGRASLLLMEKRQRGFVYDRILELLPRAVEGDGTEARAELVRIGRIIEIAGRFEEEDPRAWQAARKALQALGPEGVDAASVRLIMKLTTQDADRLLFVQEELLALGAGAVRHLVLALRTAGVKASVKERITDVLARSGAVARPALLGLFEEPTTRAGRYYAAKTLGRMGDPGALEALADAERTEADPLVRCVMIDAMARIGGPAAEKAAIRALGSEDLSVVKFGAKALVTLEAAGGVVALVDALERTRGERAEDVQREILRALRLLTGLPGGADPAWWRERIVK